MSTGTVLGLAFPGRLGRSPLADVDWERLGLTYQELMRAPLPVETDGRPYAEGLLAASPPPAGVVAVVAHCAAAPLAHETAQLLVEAGGPPLPLVLLDPDPTELPSVLTGYDACVSQTGRVPGKGDRLLPEKLLAEPRRFLDAARRSLRQHVQAGLLSEDVPDEQLDLLAEGLLDTFDTYLTYLVAAHRSGRPPWGGDAHCVMPRGRNHRADWPGARLTIHHVADADAADLLTSTRVLEIWDEVLEARRSSPT